MTQTEANRYIRTAGFFGLVAVVFSLTSATVRLPGTPISVFSGITPLIGVELVHSKAELAAILGPADSENRKLIARRTAAPGFDFVPSFVLFLLVLYRLARRFRPDLGYWSIAALVSMAATLLLSNLVVSRMAAAATAPVITDEMMNSLRILILLKWDLLFIDTILCSLFLAATPPVLRFGSNVLVCSAIAGSFAMSSNDRLVAPIVLIMFVGMCGVSALLALRPEILFASPEREAPVAPASQG